MAVGSWKSAILFSIFFPPSTSSRLLPTRSVERSDGSQEKEAVEAMVLVSFVALTGRPSVGVAC